MDDLDLARRAMKAATWFPIVPMVWSGTGDVGEPAQRDRRGVLWLDIGRVCGPPDMVPALNDAATKGCLLELARERLRDPGLHVRGGLRGPKPWAAYGGDGRPVWRNLSPDHVAALAGSTEAEVLILVLEAEVPRV